MNTYFLIYDKSLFCCENILSSDAYKVARWKLSPKQIII